MIQFENAVKRYGELILNEMKEANIICWLAGGALRDYFIGVPVTTDYDMFFPNEAEYKKAREYFEAKDCEVKWESDKGCKIKYKEKKQTNDNKLYSEIKNPVKLIKKS